MSNWIRGSTERPTKRRLVLIYDTQSAENQCIEELVQRIPYGQGNSTLLNCLRDGAENFLRKTNDPKKPKVVHSQTVPAPSEASKSVDYSPTAKRMFDME